MAVGDGGAGECGESGGHVDGADEVIGFAACGDFLRPLGEEWHAVAAFVESAFVAGERGVGMVVEAADVFVAVVHDAAVVAGENDESIVGEAVFFEGLHDLADGVVEFMEVIAASA